MPRVKTGYSSSGVINGVVPRANYPPKSCPIWIKKLQDIQTKVHLRLFGKHENDLSLIDESTYSRSKYLLIPYGCSTFKATKEKCPRLTAQQQFFPQARTQTGNIFDTVQGISFLLYLTDMRRCGLQTLFCPGLRAGQQKNLRHTTPHLLLTYYCYVVYD